MYQDIIVFGIIALTILFVMYSAVKNLKTKKTNSVCGGCTGCSGEKNTLSCSKIVEIERSLNDHRENE